MSIEFKSLFNAPECFINNGWVTVYREFNMEENPQGGVLAYFIDKSKCPIDFFDDYNSPVQYELSQTLYNEIEYCELLVLFRGETSGFPACLEIGEPFRMYFDLREKPGDDVLYSTYDYRTPVVKIEKNKIEINQQHLIDYMKRKSYILCFSFDYTYNGDKPLADLGFREEYNVITKKENLIAIHSFFDCKNQMQSNLQITGKAWLTFPENHKLELGPESFHRPHDYPNFVIGVDKNTGKEIKMKWNDNWSSEKKSQWHAYRLYFKRDALLKYLNNNTLFKVDPDLISGPDWCLRIDTSGDSFSAAFAHVSELPDPEQKYLALYSISGKGMSHGGFLRYICGIPAEISDLASDFRKAFSALNSKWNEKFGWDLFLQLTETDQYRFESLHSLIQKNEQSEFDEGILGLSIILTDSINVKELKKAPYAPEDGKGIDFLESFLKVNQLNGDKFIHLLRDIQSCRSAASAHRKSKSVEKEKFYKSLGIGTMSLKDVFDAILSNLIQYMRQLIQDLE